MYGYVRCYFFSNRCVFMFYVFIFYSSHATSPNVAKRSIWDQCKKKYNIDDRPTDRPTTDDRPTSHLAHIGKFQMAISPRGIVRSTSCLVLRWGFRGGGSNGAISGFAKSAILENSNGDISAADRRIYSVFGFRMGFLGSADRMALIPFWPNSIGMWEKTTREEWLDWSQSKVFLVYFYFLSLIFHC